LKENDIHRVISILREEIKNWDVPVVTLISRNGRDPFKVLIATVLSLRTKDKVTAEASSRLFEIADDPYKMAALPEEVIEKAIYPVGFYRRKAKNIKQICAILVNSYDGMVPDTLDELLKLPGVGRKTANLVITLGYGKLGICVDTHVHRISNRLGYVKTKSPEETEFALREKLPEEYWIEYNDLLVALGQKICHPTSPLCSKCPIDIFCNKVGVRRRR
jgi:endonuclease-3